MSIDSRTDLWGERPMKRGSVAGPYARMACPQADGCCAFGLTLDVLTNRLFVQTLCI